MFRHIAFAVRLLAIQQVDVCHRIIIVRTQLQRFIQIVEAILDNIPILLTQLDTNFLVLQRLIWPKAQLIARLCTRLVRLRPANYADGVVSLRIIGIKFDSLTVIFLGFIELLHLQIKDCYPLNAVNVIRLLIEHSVVLLDRQICVPQIVRRIHARNVLCKVSGGQIELGVDQAGIERNRGFEVLGGLLVS